MSTKNSTDEKAWNISTSDLLKFATDICDREKNPSIGATPTIGSLATLINIPTKGNDGAPSLKDVSSRKLDELVKERK